MLRFFSSLSTRLCLLFTYTKPGLEWVSHVTKGLWPTVAVCMVFSEIDPTNLKRKKKFTVVENWWKFVTRLNDEYLGPKKRVLRVMNEEDEWACLSLSLSLSLFLLARFHFNRKGSQRKLWSILQLWIINRFITLNYYFIIVILFRKHHHHHHYHQLNSLIIITIHLAIIPMSKKLCAAIKMTIFNMVPFRNRDHQHHRGQWVTLIITTVGPTVNNVHQQTVIQHRQHFRMMITGQNTENVLTMVIIKVRIQLFMVIYGPVDRLVNRLMFWYTLNQHFVRHHHLATGVHLYSFVKIIIIIITAMSSSHHHHHRRRQRHLRHHHHYHRHLKVS